MDENGFVRGSELVKSGPGVFLMPPVSEYKVMVLIAEALKEYDLKQQKRYDETERKRDEEHKENRKDLNELKEAIAESHGVKKLIAWGIPVAISIIGLIDEILRHIK